MRSVPSAVPPAVSSCTVQYVLMLVIKYVSRESRFLTMGVSGLLKLIREAKDSKDLVTLEATVVTGFEPQAVDECKEKCKPNSLVKGKGRIFFNINKNEYFKVQTMRSIDNVFIVNNAFEDMPYTQEKSEDLSKIKALVSEIDWAQGVANWAEITGFKGAAFPTCALKSGDKQFEEDEIICQNCKSSKLNDSSEQTDDALHNDNCIDVSKLTIASEHCVELDDDHSKPTDSRSTKLATENDTLDSPGEVKHEEIIENDRVATPLNDENSSRAENKASKKKPNFWKKLRKEQREGGNKNKEKKAPPKPYIQDGILKFRVTCYRNGPKHSFDSNEAACNFGGLLNDEFHWTVDLTRWDLNVVLVIENRDAYVTFGLTKSSFHRRNISHFGPTTLRATLCYSLVRLAEPQIGDIVIDPMCGGGSISLEGAISFPKTFHMCGDFNKKCIGRTRENLAFNNKETILNVDILELNAKYVPLRDHSVDVLVTDLPFGYRMGKWKDNLSLYDSVLCELSRVVRCGSGRAVLLTYDKAAMIKALRNNANVWRELRCVLVNQGGLKCVVFLLLRRQEESGKDSPQEKKLTVDDKSDDTYALIPHPVTGN